MQRPAGCKSRLRPSDRRCEQLLQLWTLRRPGSHCHSLQSKSVYVCVCVCAHVINRRDPIVWQPVVWCTVPKGRAHTHTHTPDAQPPHRACLIVPQCQIGVCSWRLVAGGCSSQDTPAPDVTCMWIEVKSMFILKVGSQTSLLLGGLPP